MLQVKLTDLVQWFSRRRETVVPEDRTETASADRIARGRLLLGEHEELDQLSGVELLQAAGWTVDVVSDGLEVVRSVQKTRYDALVLDCQLPELDGPQAATEIRRLESGDRLPVQGGRPLPIVGLTRNLTDRDRCLAAGINAYTTRPVVAQELVAKLDRLMAVVPPLEAPAPHQGVEELLESLHPRCDAVQDEMQFSEDTAETDEFLPPPPPRGPSLDDTAIDMKSLRARCLNSDAMVEKILGKFRAQLPASVTTIAKAVEDGDRRCVAREAHSLKGASANVSADRLSHVAGELEQWARRNHPTSPARLLAGLKSAAHECEEYLALYADRALAIWS